MPKPNDPASRPGIAALKAALTAPKAGNAALKPEAGNAALKTEAGNASNELTLKNSIGNTYTESGGGER